MYFVAEKNQQTNKKQKQNNSNKNETQTISSTSMTTRQVSLIVRLTVRGNKRVLGGLAVLIEPKSKWKPETTKRYAIKAHVTSVCCPTSIHWACIQDNKRSLIPFTSRRQREKLRILSISSWTTAVEITSLHTNTLASIIRLLPVSPSTWRRQTESLQRKSSFIRIALSSCNFPFHICSIKSTSAFRHFFETRLFDGYFLSKNACSQLPFHWRVGFIQGRCKVCQCYFTKPFDLDHIIIQGVIISSFLSFTCG